MITVFITFVVLGLIGMPVFIQVFNDERLRSRREQERKTALTVRIANRTHGT